MKKQKIQHYNRCKKYIMVSKCIVGAAVIGLFIKMIQLGLEYMQ
jgi:hypothetical protein